MFSTPTRDRTIESTISNLVMTGALLPPEVARYMARLGTLNDNELARQLLSSRQLLDVHYKQVGSGSRN